MPELRKDPIIGRWVIIASERSRRPSAFSTITQSEDASLCPFCPGHEEATPPEVLAYRDESTERDKPGWNLRVISNKYPALRVEGTLSREPHGIYDRMNGIGAHEVIIETPEHGQDLVDMSVGQVRNVLWAYRERMLDLQRDTRLKYTLVFKNHGAAAGASLEHSHSQVIATPIVPRRVIEKLEGAKRYFGFRERCIFCDIIRQELSDKERLVSDTDAFVAFAPFASKFPFETWIMPKMHQPSYLDMSEADHTLLAECLKDTLTRLKIALHNPAYNFMIHTRPTTRESREHFHWHLEIIPKLTRVAGFEWGSGFYINPTAPEEAAAFLRNIDTDKGVNNL